MLKLCCCECGSAEPLVRGLLQEAGITNWMSVEIHKGKEHCQTVLARFPEPYQSSLQLQALINLVKENSTFVVVLGYDKTRIYWEDISSNAPIERTRALAIVKEFA